MNQPDPNEEAIFDAAQQFAHSEKLGAYLDLACDGKPELRDRIERLMGVSSAANSFFSRPAAPLNSLQVFASGDLSQETGLLIADGPGDHIGRYKLLEKIGEGGMGIVYMAEQQEPVKRRVALKIIKLGMDTRQVVARFEAERQALALMDHPNIARIYDAGITGGPQPLFQPARRAGAPSQRVGEGGPGPREGSGEGRPYFVMELVRGVAITQYCDENRLSAAERLLLFLEVCQAVQHAHQKGIIHRDLKPSNILVTVNDGQAVPKVIDFGVAKATQQELTEKTIFTQFHHFIGTPAYMSPEQAEMTSLDIDTRSDIYALGVLLYELLTGKTPFDGKELMESGLDAMRKTIRETEPIRPSTRLSQELATADEAGRVTPCAASSREGIATDGAHGVTRPTSKTTDEISAHTSRQAGRLRLKAQIQILRGDLDWIVMKCLEKDRRRRYETANGLAADIQRHLADEPIIARPPSAVYKFRKFVRRNQAAVTAATSILLGLIAVLIFGSISYQRERAARAAADKSRTAESIQRQRAEDAAGRARQFQYVSDMNLAHQAVEEGNLFRALRLLDRHRPSIGRPVREPVLQGATPAGPVASPGDSLDLRGWEWRYLWKQCEGEQLSILGLHSNGVTAVGFLPDGKTAYSAGKDNAVRLWDLESKRRVALLPHAANVTGAACSPDGRWLATSTEIGSNSLLLWDLATMQPTAVLQTNAWLRPNSLAFSPDGKLLAFSELYKGVHLLSLATEKIIGRLPAYHHWLGPLGLAFSPNGQMLAYAENEAGDIVLWNLRDQSVVRRLKGHTWYVTALAFTPDSQLLVSGSADRTVKLWDVTSGTERGTFANYNVGVGALDISSVRLSPDGKMLATGASGGGQTITIQQVPSGKEIFRFRGHQNLVTDGAFSPDEGTFISGSMDGTVRLWDLTHAPQEFDHSPFPADCDEFSDGTSPAYSLSPDGMHLLTIFTNQTFSVWEIPALREGPRHPLPVDRAASAALSSGGKLAAFVTTNGNVVFWHGDTGETNWFSRPTTNKSSRAAFAADGKRFAIGGSRDVSVCDVPSGKTLFMFPVSKMSEYGASMSLTFSPDGQKLMAGFFSGLVKAWDFTQGGAEVALRGHDFQVNGLALLPDRTTLVSVAKDIRLWDLKSRTTQLILNPRPTVFRCVAISADGRRLAVAGNDGPITIWDLASKQEVATLAGHTRPMLALSFLSDGNTLLSIGIDEIRLWRASTLQEADARDDSH